MPPRRRRREEVEEGGREGADEVPVVEVTAAAVGGASMDAGIGAAAEGPRGRGGGGEAHMPRTWP